jgi:hypothetical protein
MFLMFHSKIINSARLGLALGFGGMMILVGPSIGGQGLNLIGVTVFDLVLERSIHFLGSGHVVADNQG